MYIFNTDGTIYKQVLFLHAGHRLEYSAYSEGTKVSYMDAMGFRTVVVRGGVLP